MSESKLRTKMLFEKSCGAIVFSRENNNLQYVIIRSKAGIYGFPKGHAEGSETEEETALREVFEETGLSVRLIDNFRREDTYTFTCNGETRLKRVVYFLAEYANQIPKAQEEELSGLHLMDYDTAISALPYESAKRLLSQAHTFLMG